MRKQSEKVDKKWNRRTIHKWGSITIEDKLSTQVRPIRYRGLRLTYHMKWLKNHFFQSLFRYSLLSLLSLFLRFLCIYWFIFTLFWHINLKNAIDGALHYDVSIRIKNALRISVGNLNKVRLEINKNGISYFRMTSPTIMTIGVLHLQMIRNRILQWLMIIIIGTNNSQWH